MRTRIINKMTNAEIENYLNRNNLIFVAVGTTENHGNYAVNVETMDCEATALTLAEQTDGIVLTDLPYFQVGATDTGRGSVQISIKDGAKYLKKLALSLLNQGFRRQIYVPAHGSNALSIQMMISDFFDETKVPIVMWSPPHPAKTDGSDDDRFIGCYRVMDKLQDIPLVDDGLAFRRRPVGQHHEGESVNFFRHIRGFVPGSGTVGFYFASPDDHDGLGGVRTQEELAVRSKLGEDAMRKAAEQSNIIQVVEELDRLDRWIQEELLPSEGKILPFTINLKQI